MIEQNPQPNATPPTSAQGNTSESNEVATPKGSVFQGLMEKLKSGGGKGNPKWVLYLLLAIIVILATGALIFWGFVIALRAMFTGDPSGANYGSGICQGAFDRSKKALYEKESAYPDTSKYSTDWCGKSGYEDVRKKIGWVISDDGKNYAINTLGIPESEMHQYKDNGKTVEDIIRAEVAAQFIEKGLSGKYESSQTDAQRAVLTYIKTEYSSLELFDSNNRSAYNCDSSGNCTQLSSLTDDKFDSHHANKRVAASYDIHYNIYLAVQEILNKFDCSGSGCPSGNGLERWKQALGLVFWPSDSGRFWGSTANQLWDHFAKEIAYICTPGGGALSSTDFRSVGPGSTNSQYGQWKDIVDVMKAVGTPGSGGKGIVSYKFMGKTISGGVNQAIVPALDKVQADLKASGVRYEIKSIEGFNWRSNVNSSNKISPHAFGVAVDVNPFNPNDNCNPRKSSCQNRDPSPSCCNHNIPKEFSDAWEKNGFFWGAKFFRISDTMHFQFGGNYDTSRIEWNGGNIIVH